MISTKPNLMKSAKYLLSIFILIAAAFRGYTAWALLLFFGVIFLSACEPMPAPSKKLVETHLPIEKISELEDLVAVASRNERSIIFVHVDWAPMKHQQQQFNDFAVHWDKLHKDQPIGFFYLDFTCASADYSPITQLPGWKELRLKNGSPAFWWSRGVGLATRWSTS